MKEIIFKEEHCFPFEDCKPHYIGAIIRILKSGEKVNKKNIITQFKYGIYITGFCEDIDEEMVLSCFGLEEEDIELYYDKAVKIFEKIKNNTRGLKK